MRIRELAEQKGWTLKQVADRSGVNYNTVRSYVQRDA
ncbi:helix-turn-helix transcriptional regulator, partial [Microcoleus sp. herbarium8]